ncbi:MAG: ATP-binding protein [Myxococcaceae bacterium]|nr:ATP-binding protein [Myxococcaceae bacterium]MCI0672372.1 ATP-binding protein [Myxococcaceae bacterium]
MSGTARKLVFAFTLLVVSFGVASVAALRGLEEVHVALHEVKEQETHVRLALTLASAVRDQYAHQAHTLILGNLSHMHLYEEAQRRVLQLLDEVDAQASTPEERALVARMRESCGELDTVFRERIVPAVTAGDRNALVTAHQQVLALVSSIQRNADALAHRYEESIRDFDQHAGVAQHSAYRWTLALLVCATLLAAAVGLYIGRSVARPVARLEAGARRIAEGDLATRIDIPSGDEFGRLAGQFNRMTEALAAHQEKLVHSERLAGIGRLAAGVAHELNNPLGVILGYVRLLERKADTALAEDLKVVEEEAVRCQEIVEGLLDLSRPLAVVGEAVDLRQLVDEVVSRLQESAQHPLPPVTVEGQGVVEGHPQRLRQVVTNLVENATEAAGPGGRVTIGIGLHVERGITVSVRDTGPGLPPEANERLFEPFFTTKASGTGLGLAVSQAIAQAHGGSIEARTLPEGGAEFSLHLPVRV